MNRVVELEITVEQLILGLLRCAIISIAIVYVGTPKFDELIVLYLLYDALAQVKISAFRKLRRVAS